MEIFLVTLGDPHRITGGYLYHTRMAQLATENDARIKFLSLPEDLTAKTEASWLSQVYLVNDSPDALVVDSIVAAQAGGWFDVALPFPIVGSVHQIPGGTSADETQRELDLATYRQMDLLLVASASLGSHLAEAGIDREVLVVPPGRDVGAIGDYVEDALQREEKRRGLRRQRQTAFLCVANWESHKGILSLLEAFEMLPVKAATLHLAGDDHVDPFYTELVRDQLKRPRLAERVVVHGVVPSERMAELYEGADVFVLPSSQDAYATAVGEAMAMGLPVVGWAAGNLPSLADDYVEGRIIPERDVGGLAKALLELVDDPELRKRLGDAARKRAAERPTWAESAAAWFGAIREVVSSNRRTPNRTPKPER